MGDRNRRGTDPYARWCERTGEATPPPTRSFSLGQSVFEGFSVLVHSSQFGFAQILALLVALYQGWSLVQAAPAGQYFVVGPGVTLLGAEFDHQVVVVGHHRRASHAWAIHTFM